MPTKKWNSKGPIGLKLKEDFEKYKYIERGITAGDVWKNNPTYQQFKLDNFRTNFNKMKRAVISQRKAEAEAEHDNQTADLRTEAALRDLRDAFEGERQKNI